MTTALPRSIRSVQPLLLALLIMALLATACSSDDVVGSAQPESTQGEGEVVRLGDDDIVLASALGTLPNCDALLDYLRAEGVERVGPYGFDNYGGGGFFEDDIAIARSDFDEAMEDEAEMAFDAAGDAADAVTDTSSRSSAPVEAPVVAQTTGANDDGSLKAGVDFSGTTVQELGIDEPDIIKTDGNRILAMANGQLHYIDVSGGDAVLRSTLSLQQDGWVSEMLFVGDRVLLFGETYNYAVPANAPVEAAAIDEPVDAESGLVATPMPVEPMPFPEGAYQGPRAAIYEVDLGDPGRMALVNQLNIEGRYLSARLVGGIARVSVQSNPRRLPFLYPQNEAGEEAARNANRDAVNNSSLEDWLPTFELYRGGQLAEEGLLASCDRVHVPSSFAGFGSLSLLSFDMNEGLSGGAAATVLASGETVYASDSSMYVATNNWFDPGLTSDERSIASDTYTTSIHGFDITGPAATYKASGSVDGHLLNQFAMSEHAGYLRVATTDGSPWSNDGNSESFVKVLQPQAEQLVEVGSVGEMGRGETIRSVRFVGDIAYVVTFRQTDPFYTVDLTEPTAPVVRGELKITGYSGQLHPISEDLVLGIGQEATEEGRTTGAKMTLFDVSNLDAPVDISNWTLTDAYTDAEWDHRAFLWWAPENLAVFPVNSWRENFWGAAVFRVDRESGITEVGRVDHATEASGAVGETACEVIDAERLQELQGGLDQDNELYWMLQEFGFMSEEGQVQICGPGESGANQLDCYEEFPVEMMRDMGADPAALGIDSDDRIEVCWPSGPGDDPIVRTLVIRDKLWSLSYGSLHAHNLSDLQRTSALDFS